MFRRMVKTLAFHTFNLGNMMSNDPVVDRLNCDPVYLKSLSDFAFKRSLGLKEITVKGIDHDPATPMTQPVTAQNNSPV